MNRPKKNHITNPTLPDDQQIDERHLVDAEDSVEVSFEDRVSIYWMENKGFISGCIFVLALLIIGFNGMRMYKTHAEAKIGEAYAAALADESLEDFAKANSKKELGSLAALSVADTAYTAEDYAKASEFYSIAAEGLSGNILEGRVRLGQAFAKYHSGEAEAGLQLLKSIAADSALAETARAEAAYHLAVEADVEGRTQEFESYVAQIESSELAGQWQQRLQMYQMQN